MFLKTIIATTLLTSYSVYSMNINIEYGFNKYSIQTSDSEITFKKKSFIDTVSKTKCNENLFNNYLRKVKSLTQKNYKDDTKTSDFMVKYSIENKRGELLPTHPFSKKLLSIPQDFDTFKLAIQFRCEVKK